MMRPIIEINQTTCINCGACAATCPALVFVQEQDRPRAERPGWCIGCGHCVIVCPVAAVAHHSLPAEDGPPAGLQAGAAELLATIRSRRSVRRFKPDPVPPEELQLLLQAGRFSPTGSNKQNVLYTVVTDPDALCDLHQMTLTFYQRLMWALDNPVGRQMLPLLMNRKLAEDLRSSLPKVRAAMALIAAGEDRLFFHAPAMIAASGPAWDTCSPFNCSAGLYAVSLLAHARGLGSCFNGYFEAAAARSGAIRRRLRLPADHRLWAAMLLGVPGERFTAPAPREPVRAQWIGQPPGNR